MTIVWRHPRHHSYKLNSTRCLSCSAAYRSRKLLIVAVQPPRRILQPDTYKSRIKKFWESRGRDYDSTDTFHQALAEKLVDLAQPVNGQAALDVATGTGMVSIPLAKRVGKTGYVTGIDISPSMLAEAERKAAEQRVHNLGLQQADAEAVFFEERSFDLILCSSAMIYLQHTDQALQRFLTWLKPGGRLCFNTPQEPCVPATSVFYSVLAQELGLHLADAAAPLADEERIKDLCQACGYNSVSVSRTNEVLLFKNSSPKDYAAKIWRAVAENAIMTPLDGLVTEKELAGIKPLYAQMAEQMAEQWVVAEGIANPYTMLWVVATK